jgi:hypothetical protein
MAFHMAFPGMAAAGLDEVSLTVGSETTTFPVFEPFGFFLMVVPDQPSGTAIRLTGHPHAGPVVYPVLKPRWDPHPEEAPHAFDLIDRRGRPLADHLVERLRPLLPDGWSLTAQPSAAVLRGEGGARATIELEWIFEQEPDVADAIVLAAEQILSHVQDDLAHHTTDPWPSERGSLPVPYARIVGEELLCGYGALELEPIRLADLLESGLPR